MKRLAFCVALLVAASTASAQSAFTRQRDSSDKSESSINSSQQLTLTPGALFFPLLAEVETRMNNGEDMAALVQQKAAQGILRMPANPQWSFLNEGCHVLLRDRWVWGTNANALKKWEGTNFKIEEPSVASQTSDRILYDRNAAQVLGVPVEADHYAWCVQYHATAIAGAISRLKNDAVEKNGVLYVRNLKARATAALYQTLVSGEIPFFPRMPATPCRLPVFSSMPSQNTFYCSPWVITQSPLNAVNAGQVVLSEDTVYGVKYAFQDSLSVSKTRSKSSTDSRKAKIDQ